jgi:predicted PurR-regulated permease PerM
MTTSSGNPHTARSNIVFVFALVLACYLAWIIRDELVLLYVSALFAVVLMPVVHATANIRIGRRQPFQRSAVFLLIFLAAAAITAFGFVALPPVIRDLQEFGREMPSRLPPLLDRFKHIPFASSLDTDDLASRVENYASQAATYLVLSISNWAGKLFDIAMGFILTIYFILEGDQAYQWFLSFVPPAGRDRLDATLQRAKIRMGKWLLGQGGLMLILGLTSMIVYLALHIRYAYALAVLTGVLNIIPVMGAAMSILLVVLVAALDSWGRVVGIIIFYAVYLQVENSVFIPRIMRNRVGLPGLAILVALLLGSALAGIVGAMVSVPTAVLVAELLDEYLVHKEPA